MPKPFDVSKFRKNITKSVPGLSVGFSDPKIWISTGNYALNYLISSDFYKGVPMGKVTVFAGESGCLPKTAKVKVRVTLSKEIEVTVGELRDMYMSGKYDIEIDTPDGYQPIIDWFDKGELPMSTISTDNNSTYCAYNHMLQLVDGTWKLAKDVVIGDKVLTVNGEEEVTKVSHDGTEQCYDFTVDHDNHRYWGDGFSSHNSGKSYIASGNIVRHAQQQGIFVVLIDTENALDKEWLEKLGVDTSDEKLLKINMSMIDDVAKTISEFMKEYKDIEEEDRTPVLFVVDSLGMLLTPTDVDQFTKGDMKGDMGRKPKALMALVRNTVNMFGAYDVGMVATNHTYASQDMFDPDPKVAGGNGFVYASSILVAMKKMKLKEDNDGNKVSDVRGIRAGCKVMKTRYAKPFEDVQVKIPYDVGMDPYSGLFDVIEKKGLLTKSGNSYVYTDIDGNEYKAFRKKWERNEDGLLDMAMKDIMARDEAAPPATFSDMDDDIDVEDIIDSSIESEDAEV